MKLFCLNSHGLRSLSLKSARPDWRVVTLALGLALGSAAARADAVEALHGFVENVRSGRAQFTQTVTSPDGAKTKKSTGTFEFQRPNRFRFDYLKPYEQQIVADGQKVWMYDLDLQQVTTRPYDQALGSTPAALLSGGKIDKDFVLKALPDEGGMQWVQADPRSKDSGIRALRVGFRGADLSVFEMTDAFGQRSRLDFSHMEANASLPATRFQFVPPKGADVLKP